VDARDPVVLASVVAALVGAGLLASFVPARRVTRIDPVRALAE
jgi:ABC-type antimicrobial peptide transport system permease subunit